MVETTEVDGTILKVCRDRNGDVTKCVKPNDREVVAHELEQISDIEVCIDTDGLDIWVLSRDRLSNMNTVFKRLHEHGYAPRAGSFDREHTDRRNGEERPGFMYAMPEESVSW